MLLSLFGGSDMALGDGLVMSVIGIGIVFLVLAFLMLFITIMSRAITGAKKTEAPAAPAAPAAAPAAAPVAAAPAAAPAGELAKGSCGVIKTFGVDDRTAAMLMAIVADKMQKPLNEIRFISMHEVQE